MPKYIERNEYLNKLISFKDTDIIKIITGIRRCGKSTLMEIFQQYLLKNGISEKQIIKINFEDFTYRKLLEPELLHEYIMQNIKPGIMNYIELATMISGRYVEIRMLPLSFKEFVSVQQDKNNLPVLYRRYIEYGSFPGVLVFDRKQINDYLEGIYNTVVIKDIMVRKNISDPLMLESVVRFVFDNIGNELSSKKIADTMTSEGRKIDVRTVEKYLSALTEAFIVYKAGRYNIKGRQHLRNNEKYYAVDMALRTMLLGERSFDAGHILENIVYLELLRRGYTVFVGKIDMLEVDFVAVKSSEIIYYQVAATVRDDNTLKRELASLMKINDHYPKFILTLDEDPDADYNGIRRINVLDWLLA